MSKMTDWETRARTAEAEIAVARAELSDYGHSSKGPDLAGLISRAIDHERALRSKSEAVGVRVKPIGEWRRGYRDERVTIEQVSFCGMYQVRVLDGAVWLDWPKRTAEIFPSVDEAKAAAQADFEARILSALTHPAPATVVSDEMVRAELVRRDKLGELVTYAVADDRGLEIDEYVELIVSVVAALTEEGA